MTEKTKSTGVFIPDITVEMLKKAPIEAIEGLLSEGEILDIDIEEIKESAYQRGLGQNKWTPCSERLPEEDLPVLVAVKQEGRLTKWVKKQTYSYVTDIDVYDDGNFYVHKNKVVAWRPLPEPYKEV